jgi:phospholipid transport system substrate-binding protein
MFRMFVNRWLVAVCIIIIFASSSAFSEDSPVSSSSATSAKQVVEDFQKVLIEAMKEGQKLGYQGRYDKLAPAIISSHDLTKIARIVVGKEWESLSEQQQVQLVDVFTKLSISSYAHNFKDYSGETFRFETEEETSRGGVVVHTTLLIPNDKDVRFDYMLKEKPNGWSIINIIANGVSDLALKRSEYTSILQRQGFDALIAKINEKISNYSKL